MSRSAGDEEKAAPAKEAETLLNRTFLDRVVGWISPQAELGRIQARARIDAAAKVREYAGATAGRRAGDWVRGSKDGTSEVRSAGKRLREAARSLVRDNAYASQGLEEWEANLAPITGSSMVNDDDPQRAQAINDVIDTVWYEWCCKADYDGLTSFDGLQFLIARALIQDGGCLVRRRKLPPGAPIPFQLQLHEMDWLDESRDFVKLDNGGTVMGGIQFGADGRRQGYWLLRQHPGSEQTVTALADRSMFVPASEILHIFEPTRPGQQLGASRFASVILRSRDIDGYEEAELVRKQTEACIAAFVEDASPDAVETQTVGASVTDFEGRLIETFSPGMMAYLPPGRRVQFNQPSATGGYADYMRAQLRGMAAGLGLPFETMTGDLSQVTFISGRMGLLSFRRRVRKIQNKVLIPQLLEPVWQWFIDAGQASGAIGATDKRIWAKWTPPRWESIQPLDDANADLIDIRSGARTLAQVITERGGNPADQLGEIAETNALLDKSEIILDSDPRNRTKVGGPVAATAAPAADGGVSPPDGGGDAASKDEKKLELVA